MALQLPRSSTIDFIPLDTPPAMALQLPRSPIEFFPHDIQNESPSAMALQLPRAPIIDFIPLEVQNEEEMEVESPALELPLYYADLFLGEEEAEEAWDLAFFAHAMGMDLDPRHDGDGSEQASRLPVAPPPSPAAVDFNPLEVHIEDEEMEVESSSQEFTRYINEYWIMDMETYELLAADINLDPLLVPTPILPAGHQPSTFRSRVGHPSGGLEGGGVIFGIPAPAPLNLEKMHYGEGAGAGEGTSADSTACAICIQDYEVGDELSVVPCSGNHRFHSGCLDAWTARKRSCPLCRHALSS